MLLALPVSLISLLLIFILRPLIKIRIGFLRSDRIGHFGENVELYLCEKEVSQNLHKTVDLFYFTRKPYCNQQLARMWARKLIVLPWFLLRPLDLIIRSFSCFSDYRALEARGADRDLDNLLDKLPPHLAFTAEEEERGIAGLLAMGIRGNSRFVCLNVRDGAYLNQIYTLGDTSYHNYRDSDVQNYVLAAEELAERGYFVIRMGAKVHAPINSSHPRVIDYAANGMRSDFMDIYLGARCTFCITTGTGWDVIPEIQRRPIVFVNFVPLGYLHTSRSVFLSLAKRHVWKASKKELTLREIFFHRVGFCLLSAEYELKGVDLIENTPEEILDVVIEMADRLEGTYQIHPDDQALQRRFRELFPADALDVNGVPIHGQIRSRYCAAFLRNNQSWLS